ncbi:trypsin-like peptidase domain-containing protein [Neiella sp. HB171785]|uniref:Trypsin-like peptidase domain-containing protein n=2 Tax=Neiella litorisoli TaxID=2771431 RepID=A0A8J6UGR1_9GAMM|nr:trypsin-like peptidase domain-containing protein [Neiella litorisoli]
MIYRGKKTAFIIICWLSLAVPNVFAHNPLPQTIQKVKPSVVGIGLFDPLAAPKATLMATGFAIGNGTLIATNAHAIPKLNKQRNQSIAVLIPGGRTSQVYKATLVARDDEHDLAIVKLTGKRLPTLQFSQKTVLEGQAIAFTGFPIGSVLGLYPTTHRGIIATKTPVMLPVPEVGKLTAKQLKRLREPYEVYQLDATAYPGNSGSPVYDQETGDVIAIINKVLLTGNKESALTNPSAISYAIPVKHLQDLLDGL